jgi:hypothetical protein
LTSSARFRFPQVFQARVDAILLKIIHGQE